MEIPPLPTFFMYPRGMRTHRYTPFITAFLSLTLAYPAFAGTGTTPDSIFHGIGSPTPPIALPAALTAQQQTQRLERALISLWATTKPGNTYAIGGQPFPRADNGTFTSPSEPGGPYTFGPTIDASTLQNRAPTFVRLLLSHYAQQELLVMKALQDALLDFLAQTNVGDPMAVGEGTLTHNSDDTVMYVGPEGVFIINPFASDLSDVARALPNLAAAWSKMTGYINPQGNKTAAAILDNDSGAYIDPRTGNMYDPNGNKIGTKPGYGSTPGATGKKGGTPGGGNTPGGSGTGTGSTGNDGNNPGGGTDGSTSKGGSNSGGGTDGTGNGSTSNGGSNSGGGTDGTRNGSTSNGGGNSGGGTDGTGNGSTGNGGGTGPGSTGNGGGNPGGTPGTGSTGNNPGDGTGNGSTGNGGNNGNTGNRTPTTTGGSNSGATERGNTSMSGCYAVRNRLTGQSRCE